MCPYFIKTNKGSWRLACRTADLICELPNKVSIKLFCVSKTFLSDVTGIML